MKIKIFILIALSFLLLNGCTKKSDIANKKTEVEKQQEVDEITQQKWYSAYMNFLKNNKINIDKQAIKESSEDTAVVELINDKKMNFDVQMKFTKERKWFVHSIYKVAPNGYQYFYLDKDYKNGTDLYTVDKYNNVILIKDELKTKAKELLSSYDVTNIDITTHSEDMQYILSIQLNANVDKNGAKKISKEISDKIKTICKYYSLEIDNNHKLVLLTTQDDFK